MLRRLASVGCRWLQRGDRALQSLIEERTPAPDLFAPISSRSYRPLERIVLSDEVYRVLFDEYARHREGDRGEEEIGWLLLGLREETEVFVLATLPAGADRQAGVAHVQFNSDAQALAALILRQSDRRLGLVGVVHTHPGSLRHPSSGDYQGDILWVERLRGKEGIFGIGTADAKPIDAGNGSGHRQIEGDLCLSWYGLAASASKYHQLPVIVLPGPDLARPLHPFWPVLEAHAESLSILYRQLARVMVEVGEEPGTETLLAKIPLIPDAGYLLIELQVDQLQCFWENTEGERVALNSEETDLVRVVYLHLADLVRETQRQRLLDLARA